MFLCQSARADGFYETSDMLSAGCRIAIRTWSEQNPNSIDLLLAQSCNGYMQGALDTFEFEKVTGSQKFEAQSVCVPYDLKSEQAIRVFMKYSDDHPEELHYSAPTGRVGSHAPSIPLSQVICRPGTLVLQHYVLR